MQASFNKLLGSLTAISTSVSRNIEQGKQMLDMTREVIRININVFQIVLSIQRFITEIPGQVQRQKPVFLIDALGKESPFHLEFVRSADALVAVFTENFRKHGSGATLIKIGNFVVSEASSDHDIDLTQDWELCFSPGQHVNMSMIFDRLDPHSTSCPYCQYDCKCVLDEDIECLKCGLIFRRIVDESDGEGSSVGSLPERMPPRLAGPDMSHDKRKCKRSMGFNQELSLYRRVRIRKFYLNVDRHEGFKYAVNYIAKIKAAYHNKPKLYGRFLELLLFYVEESTPAFEVAVQIVEIYMVTLIMLEFDMFDDFTDAL